MVILRFTAQGNLADNIAIASFDPSLNFTVSALLLEIQKFIYGYLRILPFLETKFATEKNIKRYETYLIVVSKLLTAFSTDITTLLRPESLA